jgi:SNF2 family DNA or RNA helicase
MQSTSNLNKPASNTRIIDLTPDKKIKVKFDYDNDIYKTIKGVHGGYFVAENSRNKYWLFGSQCVEKLIDVLIPFGFEITDALDQYLETIREEKRLAKEKIENRVDWCFEHLESESEEWNFTPYLHQWETINFILNQPNLSAIISDDPGLGKTLSALISAKAIRDFYRFEYGEFLSIIVVCPVSLKLNWLIEAEKVKLKLEIFSHAKTPKAPINKKYILIADEAHVYKNPASARSKKFLELAADHNCVSVLAMTATPMLNGRHAELYPLLKAIKHPVADSKKYYDIRYCDAKPTAFTAWDVTGSINSEELSERISDKLIKHRKEECIDLPEKTIIDIFCEPNKVAEDEYNENIEQLKQSYLERASKGEVSLQAEALVTLGHLRRSASIYKSYQTINTVQSMIDAGLPVVVFAEFRESADRIAAHFNVKSLNGDTKLEDRQQMVDDFQSGKNLVFVGSIAAGGVGITLTRANYLVMNDFPWNPGLYTQATDRIHRIGQNKNCTIYNIFGKDIDYVMATINNQKSTNIDRVINEKIGVIPDKLDSKFYQRLVEKLLDI